MYDMSQMQSWLQMMNQMKGQGGRNEWEGGGAGEPNSSAEYQWQLGQAGRDQAEEERQIRMAMLGAQARQASQQSRLTEAQVAVEKMKSQTQHVGGSQYWGGPRSEDVLSYPYMTRK